MASDVREDARTRRSESRERRRGGTSQPIEALADSDDEQQGDAGSERDGRYDAVKQAAVAAAATAVVAGLAGAAKALADRRSARRDEGAPSEEGGEGDARADASKADDDEQEAADASDREADEQPVAAATAAEEETPEQAAAERADADGDEEDEDGESGLDAQASEASEAEADEREGDDDDENRPEADAPAAGGDAGAIVRKARDELERLLATDVETVSGLEQNDGHWTVTLEVVEVRRVPDSTDVLATYELELDDDKNVIRMARTRRYRRSQIEDSR